MSAAEKKWERQPGLFDYAKSRWDNPSTSREAAQSISLERVSETQKRVIEVFRFNGWEMSDERLVELYEGYWPNSVSTPIKAFALAAGSWFARAESSTPASGRSRSTGDQPSSGGWCRDDLLARTRLGCRRAGFLHLKRWSCFEQCAFALEEGPRDRVVSRIHHKEGRARSSPALRGLCDGSASVWIGIRSQTIKRLVADENDVLDLLDQVTQGKHGGARSKSNNVNLAPKGNTIQSALRRLRKDRSDLHEEVLAGNLSAHAAMVAAGFRPTITVRLDDPERIGQTLIRRLDRDDCRAVVQTMTELLGMDPNFSSVLPEEN